MEEKHPKFSHLCYNYVPLYGYITALQRLQAPANTAPFIPVLFERTEFQRCEVIHHMLVRGRGRAHTRILLSLCVSSAGIWKEGSFDEIIWDPSQKKPKGEFWTCLGTSSTLHSVIKGNELTNKVNQMSCLIKLADRLAFVGRPCHMYHQPPVWNI